MLKNNNWLDTFSICLITFGNLIFLSISQPALANPRDLDSLQISQPTILLNWSYVGKFLLCQL